MTDWLLGTLFATTGLIVLVLALREPVRRAFGSRVAYGLWLIPAARLLMPTLSQTIERPVGVITPRTFTSQAMAEPLLLSSVAQPQPSLIEQAGGWPVILLVLWLGVAAGLFAARILAFRRERAAILRNATEIGRVGSIRLVRSPEVSGPLAFGIFDRVIAVPADFEFLFAEHERQLALEHELAHHRSGDLVANLFAFTLLCLQWFNPIAWAAHAAFRFDQEAACDARVLDKAGNVLRSDYGRAIAKATSGRALLFASALDRRTTLQRRLKSMLSNPTAGRRLSGRMMVIVAIGVALPLTATRAIHYVDVPMVSKAPAEPRGAVPAQAVAAALAAQPAKPATPHQHSNLSVDDGMVTINGQTKKWQDMTPAEKAEVRRSLAQAKADIARVNQTKSSARSARRCRNPGSIRTSSAAKWRPPAPRSTRPCARSMRTPRTSVAPARTPSRSSRRFAHRLKAVEAIDVEAITRQAMASVDPTVMEKALAAAEAGLEKAEAELERLDELNERDDD